MVECRRARHQRQPDKVIDTSEQYRQPVLEALCAFVRDTHLERADLNGAHLERADLS